MAAQMSDAEFAAKAEYEGVGYAVLDYGLSADDLADKDTALHAAMVEVDRLKDDWRAAIAQLEAELEQVSGDD